MAPGAHVENLELMVVATETFPLSFLSVGFCMILSVLACS